MLMKVEENGQVVHARQFKRFPKEWRLLLPSCKLSNLPSLVPRLANSVALAGGQFLVHISREKDEKIREMLYQLGFNDHFQNLISEITLPINQIAPPLGYKIIRQPPSGHNQWQEIYRLECHTSDTIPGRQGFAHPPMSEYLRRFSNGEADLESLHLAVHDDQVVGLTYAFIDEVSPGIFYTGVGPDHRGRGLGSALKSALANHLHSRGFLKLSTSNRSDNYPILATNHRLGFEVIDTEYLLRLPLG